MDKLDHAGIEISSEEFLVLLCRNEKTLKPRKFPNTDKGRERVCRYLAMKKDRVVRAVMESTGVYGLDLAISLYHNPGVDIMVANPRAVRDYAKAAMNRSKTDEVDVRVLLQFAQIMPFRPYTAPSDSDFALRAIARRIHAMNKQMTQEKNRLHAAERTRTTPQAVRTSLLVCIDIYKHSIKYLTGEALGLIRDNPKLARRFELLTSVKGIADASAIQILGEIVCLPDDLEPRQLVALAGLDPKVHKSGKSVDRTVGISRQGNKNLRTALFMPAMVAISCEPGVKAFYEHLVAKGKKKMQAIVAVMRKLLHSIYGMFKNNQPFDGSRFYPALTPVCNL